MSIDYFFLKTKQAVYIISNETIKVGDSCFMVDDFNNLFLGYDPQDYLGYENQHLNKGLRKVICNILISEIAFPDNRIVTLPDNRKLYLLIDDNKGVQNNKAIPIEALSIEVSDKLDFALTAYNLFQSNSDFSTYIEALMFLELDQFKQEK